MKGTGCLFLILAAVFLAACRDGAARDPRMVKLLKDRKKDVVGSVPGENEPVPKEIVRRGEVLIGYSDCYTCHRDDEKKRAPAFRDIAIRYPLNEVYVNMLASKVIGGGSGAWGYAVMTPHPDLPEEDARAMVTYILSLDIGE